MKGSFEVYRIEYEVVPSLTSYKAFIVASSHEDAVKFLYSYMRNSKINITASGPICAVHGFTPNVLNQIYNKYYSKAMGVGGSEVKPKLPPEIKEFAKSTVTELAGDDNVKTLPAEDEDIKFKSGRGVKKTKK